MRDKRKKNCAVNGGKAVPPLGGQSNIDAQISKLIDGKRYHFRDGLCVDLPMAMPGVYAIWRDGALLYVGIAGRSWKPEPNPVRMRGIKDRLEWARYLSGYYRFPMHRLSHSDQHNRLRNLALLEPFVFYVSPRFYRLVEFNGYYRGAAVSQESVWIPVSSLPLISDNLQHHVTYRTGADVRFASPESQPIDKTFDGEGLKVYMTKEFQTQKKAMELASFNQLRTELLAILKEGKMQYFPELSTRADDAQQIFKDITYLSRTFFGAEFLLVHEP
jgi:hypothetical protein